MKKRLFGHFGFVYSEIFSHASGMQNVSKLNHFYAKLQQFFVLINTNFLLNIPCLTSDSTKTIRLLARDFYAVIVDSGFALINYHRIEISSS